MYSLLNSLYDILNKSEIEKAITILKRIKIDTILQRMGKLCWKHNIQYEVIIKTTDTLILRIVGMKEIILFKYHKTEIVSKDEMDFFMNELDEHNANKGFYVTTGRFQIENKKPHYSLLSKYDLIFEDGVSFIKNNLGLKGKAEKDFIINKLNFLKYLPI